MNHFLHIALIALCATGAAHAGSISFSDSHGPTLTDWDPAQSLSLQRFDPGLGMLTKVSFLFSGSMRADFDVTNTARNERRITNRMDGEMGFALPTSSIYGLTLEASETLNLAPQASHTSSIRNTAARTEFFTTDLASFIGAGSFAVDVVALATTRVTGSGNVFGGADTLATATARVTYDFTEAASAVPEPASLALVGLALAGVALSRRRA